MLPDVVLRYAGHEDAVIDVHLPDGALPTEHVDRIVVLVHGGFWKSVWDRRHTRPLARALADRGQVVVTPEYRRVGPGPGGGGGWPVTGDDLLLALRRLPELLGGLGMAVAPLTVAGHSAGGQLALWLATTDLPVSRVVALAPVCDLQEAIRQRLGSDAARALLAESDPAEADPMVLLTRRPVATVHVVHGDQDEDVPVTLSRGLVARHPWIDLHDLPGVGHMELIGDQGPIFDLVLELLTAP